MIDARRPGDAPGLQTSLKKAPTRGASQVEPPAGGRNIMKTEKTSIEHFRTPAVAGGQRGSTLFFALIAIVLLFTLGAIIATALSKSMYQSRRDAIRVKSFSAAEAAANEAMFYAGTKMYSTYGNFWGSFVANELYVNQTTPTTHQGVFDGIPVEYWFEDNLDSDGTDAYGQPIRDQRIDSDDFIWIYARALPAEQPPTTLRVLIHAPPPPESMSYAFFGNRVEFHNHNGVPYGVIMYTSVFSNSDCNVDSAIQIEGQIVAVEKVELNKGPRGNHEPYAVVNPMPIQGDSKPMAGVRTTSPPPQIIPFPKFRFEEAKQIAINHGTYFPNNQAFLNYLMDPSRTKIFYQNSADPATWRVIDAPTPQDLDRRFPIGDLNGDQKLDPLLEKHTVYVYELTAANPNDLTYDNIYYVEGSLKLAFDMRRMVRIEGSLIVTGSLDIECAGEFLQFEERDSVAKDSVLRDANELDTNRSSILDGNGDGIPDRLCDLDGDGSLLDFRSPTASAITMDRHYSRYPAIVAGNDLKIGGDKGGPVHIEGTMYTAGASHLHRSEAWGPVFVLGNEIADFIHNCEYISFQYDSEIRYTIGLGELLLERPDVRYYAFDENPPVPQIPALGTGTPAAP
jgi:hypothetical protein